MSGRDLREWTIAQVRSAMTAAMRTDPHALDALAGWNPPDLDPHSLSFLRTARTLTLATSAALSTVLSIHRYGRDPYDRIVCLACGIDRCRTVRGVSDVLTAYGLQTHPVDRPEAWRLADAWYTKTAGHPVLLSVESFVEGFIARPATSPPEAPDNVLIIDRNTGALTLWPSYDTDTLASEYHNYKRGTL
ncbi:hypothetical protein E1293_29885 [Actinomadura darangshiensis]|uniref:Uncharacterized protein n=1 Tax=Actinomadura darangshiensis TaxID=705336 RepID=A0A4R5AN72_9ACTN|nr:hypothetical protein [Actinomadura darangshiensis]TDD74231.1 hypothetical protein E1293_29885 [Actinomadura darangshiensis]